MQPLERKPPFSFIVSDQTFSWAITAKALSLSLSRVPRAFVENPFPVFKHEETSREDAVSITKHSQTRMIEISTRRIQLGTPLPRQEIQFTRSWSSEIKECSRIDGSCEQPFSQTEKTNDSVIHFLQKHTPWIFSFEFYGQAQRDVKISINTAFCLLAPCSREP